MKKKVLLLGSSFSAAPMLFELKNMGFCVEVCGDIPSDPCHQYSDESIKIDYSKKRKLLNFLKEKKTDYVVPTCNDDSYMTGAYLAEKLNFIGFDSTENAGKIHKKTNFKELLKKLKIPNANYLEVSSVKQLKSLNLRYPLLVKPDDSYSGKGITKIRSNKEINEAFNLAKKFSKTGKVFCEEYIKGTLHSHSAFLSNQKIIIDHFADEFCTRYPYQVNCSNSPSFLSSKTKNEVQKYCQTLAQSLDLNDGLLHMQFILKKGKAWILEAMRRCPGDLFPKMIEMSTGFNYTKHFIMPFIGQSYEIQKSKPRKSVIIRHTITTNKSIRFSSFSQKMPFKDVHIIPLKKSGEFTRAAPFDKIAIIFAKAHKKIDAKKTPENCKRLVSIFGY